MLALAGGQQQQGHAVPIGDALTERLTSAGGSSDASINNTSAALHSSNAASKVQAALLACPRGCEQHGNCNRETGK